MKYCSLTFLLLVVLLSKIDSKNENNNSTRYKEEELSLRLGNSLHEENKIDESLLVFQDFIDLYPDSDWRILVLEKIAVVYEEKQQFVSAKKVYHQLFEELGFSSKGLKYYLEEARLFEIMGEIKKAQKIYALIKRSMPDSNLALKAQRRLELNKLFEESSSEKMMPANEMKIE